MWASKKVILESVSFLHCIKCTISMFFIPRATCSFTEHKLMCWYNIKRFQSISIPMYTTDLQYSSQKTVPKWNGTAFWEYSMGSNKCYDIETATVKSLSYGLFFLFLMCLFTELRTEKLFTYGQGKAQKGPKILFTYWELFTNFSGSQLIEGISSVIHT